MSEMLRKVIESYSPLSDETWSNLSKIIKIQSIKKGDYPCRFGDVAKELIFVVDGLLRAYILDEEGHEYNKNFFLENNFAGSTVSLLTQNPSNFEIEALEDSTLIMIDYGKFRELLLEKEAREVALVQESATQRYQTFIQTYPTLESRVPQYLIASHLGITPTQLSRIRKSINICK